MDLRDVRLIGRGVVAVLETERCSSRADQSTAAGPITHVAGAPVGVVEDLLAVEPALDLRSSPWTLGDETPEHQMMPVRDVAGHRINLNSPTGRHANAVTARSGTNDGHFDGKMRTARAVGLALHEEAPGLLVGQVEADELDPA
jgi:hypothetical protein